MADDEPRLAVVTGGAGLLGLATTKVLIEEGYKVVVADWDEKALLAASAQFGDKVVTMAFDVSDEDAVVLACEKVRGTRPLRWPRASSQTVCIVPSDPPARHSCCLGEQRGNSEQQQEPKNHPS